MSEVASPEGQPTPFTVIFVTGLSGAGKSTVLNVFEDMRFFTMDGLPANLIPDLVVLFSRAKMSGYRGLAVGLNLLDSGAIDEWREALDNLAQTGITCRIIFVEADLRVLTRRYATTRRPHPLECEGFLLEAALEEEKQRLSPVRAIADSIIDTTAYSIHDLRRAIQSRWSSVTASARSMRVNLMSFGFKYGLPADAEMMFDLRFLPNPYFVTELKERTGMETEVADYVLETEPGKSFFARTLDYLLYLLPLYEAEGRYRISIAIGCTGGRHRSVAFAEAMAKALKRRDFAVTLEHRHMTLG